MKTLWSLLIPVIMLHAFDTDMAAKIYDRLFHAVIKKEQIRVYAVDKEYIKVIRQASELQYIDELEKADIALINHKEFLPSTIYPLVFTTDIRIYKEHSSSIGVFYWKHSRPVIIFSKERLKRFNITLSSQWSKYVKSDSEL